MQLGQHQDDDPVSLIILTPHITDHIITVTRNPNQEILCAHTTNIPTTDDDGYCLTIRYLPRDFLCRKLHAILQLCCLELFGRGPRVLSSQLTWTRLENISL